MSDKMKLYVFVNEAHDVYDDEALTGYFFTTKQNAQQYIDDYNKDTTSEWKPIIKEVIVDPIFADAKIVWQAWVNIKGELTAVEHREPYGDDDMKADVSHIHNGPRFYGCAHTRQGAIDSAFKIYEQYNACLVTKSQTVTWLDQAKFKKLTEG